MPLLVQAYTVNFDVRMFLVDLEALYNIMYTSPFEPLQLTKKNLVQYVGFDIFGFNVSSHIEPTLPKQSNNQDQNLDQSNNPKRQNHQISKR